MGTRNPKSNDTAIEKRRSSALSVVGKDESVALSAVLDRDETAWRRFVAEYDAPLRAVVRHATEATHPLSDDQVDEVMGDFWLALVAHNMRLLRAFNPSRGASLLTWLTFHVAQLAYEHVRRVGEEPAFVPLDEARHVPAPRARMPRLRNESVPTVDDAIRAAVRDAVASEVQAALARQPHAAATSSDEGFISINRAAQIADTHPATIRAWIRAGKLHAGRTGRHYKVRKADVIKIIEGSQHADSTIDFKGQIAAIMANDRES